ncbi:MAG: Rv3235 family protein [Demequina sp.]|uniref:Rv3235 family protein n=1 Tax=Demequina sp. TaxID=2050685 RepID=UPI003A8AE04F
MTAATVSTPSTPTPAIRHPQRGAYARHRKPLGDPAPLACTLAKAVVESLRGGEDLTTLARWIAPEVRAALTRQRTIARRRAAHEKDVSAPATARVKRARVCRTAADAAEVCAIVDDGTRTVAVAMRFEDHHGRWLATVIEVL